MKIKLAILLLAVVFSCKSESGKTTEANTDTVEISTTDNELQLNNGKKWIANTETHIGMKRIDSILKNHSSLDATVLGEALSKQTSYIIKSCNMKGKAHDQLHVVLLPILEEISVIKDEKNITTPSKSIAKLKTLSVQYFNYFDID